MTTLPLATQYRITDLFDAGQGYLVIARDLRLDPDQVKAVIDEYVRQVAEDTRLAANAGAG